MGSLRNIRYVMAVYVVFFAFVLFAAALVPGYWEMLITIPLGFAIGYWGRKETERIRERINEEEKQ